MGTECPKSLVHLYIASCFYKVSHYIIWVKTSWTYSIQWTHIFYCIYSLCYPGEGGGAGGLGKPFGRKPAKWFLKFRSEDRWGKIWTATPGNRCPPLRRFLTPNNMERRGAYWANLCAAKDSEKTYPTIITLLSHAKCLIFHLKKKKKNING